MMNPLSQKAVNVIDPTDRKIPRTIFGPTLANVVCRIRDKKIYTLYDDVALSTLLR
jgi:hypothetical protein